jgi:KUP system potassium uptake protein
VIVLTLVFRSADKLGDIYGVAVTGTFILNTVLFVAVARTQWGTRKRRLVPVAALFLTVEVVFFSSNIAKVQHGAWLSLAIGLVLSLVMMNWRRGQAVVTRNRVEQEGSLRDFLDGLPQRDPELIRVPGVAVFLNPSAETTPLALRAQVEHNGILQEKVVIASVETVSVPHVDPAEGLKVQRLGQGLFKVLHVTARVGYHDEYEVPSLLALARKRGLLQKNLDLEHATYFVSRMTIKPLSASPLRAWRKKLFIVMARNAASPIDHFGLPTSRTVIMGAQVCL